MLLQLMAVPLTRNGAHEPEQHRADEPHQAHLRARFVFGPAGGGGVSGPAGRSGCRGGCDGTGVRLGGAHGGSPMPAT